MTTKVTVVILLYLLAQTIFCIALDDPLTEQERELMVQFDDMESSLLKPLQVLLESTVEELQHLTASKEIIQKLKEENKKLEELAQEISSETNEFEQRIVTFNQKQLQKLNDRIDEVLDTEWKHRETQISENTSTDDMEGIEGVTFDEIQKYFDTETTNSHLVSDLQAWVTEKLGEAWLKRIEEYVSHGQDLIASKLSTLEDAFGKSGKNNKRYCADAEKATMTVYSELSQLTYDKKTKGGLPGTSVVYGSEWTSDTYENIANDYRDSHLNLGYEMFRKYIPQDWERFFPAIWKDWDLSKISSQILIPSYVFHSLPSHVVSFLKLHFGLRIQAPVETILSSNNHLGSCWRFPGRNGKVTLRLSKPTIIQNVTITHYPWLETAHNPKNFKRHILSAPRFLRMVGYPPCHGEDNDCLDLQGFDVSKPMNLGSFEYKIESSVIDDNDDEFLDEVYEEPQSSVQTFVLSSPEQIKDDDDEEENYVSSSSSSACSAVKSTCGGEDPEMESTSVVAVTLYIDENWGYEDFTCLYQVEVHGEIE
jgi:hypothetical protein